MTSESIRIREFQTVKKNGYDPEEVQVFLSEIAVEFKRLEERIQALQTENEALKTKAPQEAPSNDKVLEVLESLKRTSEELIEQSKTNAAAIANRSEQERRLLFEQAKKEADIIIRDAEKKSDAIMERAYAKVQEYRDEIGILQARRLAIISRVKSLLASQQQFLESLEQDALGQTRELTDVIKETGSESGISADQLESILKKLEDHQGKS